MDVDTDKTYSSGLLGRMAESAAQRHEPAGDADEPIDDGGVYSFTAEFYTAYRTIFANLTSAESRLSDHLNGRSRGVDVSPTYADHDHALARVDLTGTHGSLTKDRVLFAIPLVEPPRPHRTHKVVWKSTVTLSCWAGVGSYGISGHLHVEADRDPGIAWKQMDREFISLTEATIAFPDGRVRDCRVVIVNSRHLDILTMMH